MEGGKLGSSSEPDAKARLLRDASPDAIVLLNSKGRVREWNAAAEAMFGYKAEQAMGRDITSLIDLGGPLSVQQDLCRYREGGASAFLGKIREVAAVRANGLEITVEVVALPIPGSLPTDFHLHIRDVTARKREMATYIDFYDKMRSFHQDTAREMATISHELDLAHSIQKAALPVHSPEVPGWDIAARYEFDREVGGDFYLYLTGENRLDVVVGDVAGKGVPAALTSTSISHLLPWLRKMEPVEKALADLNEALGERLPTDSFVTLVLAEISLTGGEIGLWNAGHPCALRWDASAAMVRRSLVHNPFLGVLDDWSGSAETWTLAPGEAVVLYTDGLVETRNAGGEEFGQVRCAAILERVADWPAAEIADAMLKEVKAFGRPHDDVTVLVCKRFPEVI
jgi:sigma-B regulation protein RsbU (phosphoserine phosphatase)